MDLCQLFERAHAGFAQRGLLGRAVLVRVQGRSYRVRCDADCFTVYRVNEKPHLPPGVPGWTVCRLEREQCFCLQTDENACLPPQDQALPTEALAWVDMALAGLDQRPNP